MILTAEDFDSLYHLGSVQVTYSPRNINTEAIQVTKENIGALSVELRQDLRYGDDGQPFFSCDAARKDKKETGQAPYTVMNVRVGDWVVVLWDELHVFRDYEFKHTFDFVDPKPAHLLAETLQFEQREEDVQRGFQPTVAGDLSNMTPPAERL